MLDNKEAVPKAQKLHDKEKCRGTNIRLINVIAYNGTDIHVLMAAV